MPSDIKCPNCGTVFDVENVISAELEIKFQKDYQERLQESLRKTEAERKKLEDDRRSFEEKKKNENELFLQKLAQERKKMESEIQVQLRKSISGDYENKLTLLEKANKENEEKLRQSRKLELEMLQKEKDLQNKEAELEIRLQRKLQEEREVIAEQIRKQEINKNLIRENEHLLRLKEMEKQLEDQKKLAEEMRRKAEQGSMQLQGEVQELALEEMLRSAFPFDLVTEVGKGVRGADCILTVRNNFGQECGKIIYECKRTNNFSNDWIDKLKADMRSQGADLAILVTQAMPKDLERFGEKEGVWVCSFGEVKALSQVLRDGVLRIFSAIRKQENKGDKMHMLYDYLTGNEFAGQWKAIREGFQAMKASIQKERDAMEKLWKAREKQLEKVLLNAVHIRGSIEGIAGQDSVDMNLLDEEDDPLLLE